MARTRIKISARRYMNTANTEWWRVINGKHFGFVVTAMGVEVWEYRGINRGRWERVRTFRTRVPAAH